MSGNIILGITIFFLLVQVIQAAEDQRCRCVCPQLRTVPSLAGVLALENSTDIRNKSVYIRNNVDPEDCECESILDYSLPKQVLFNISDLSKFCLRCQCEFEQRNSTTQQVVIIFVIIIFGLLFVYGCFLMCLDPIMNSRRKRYTRQVDSAYTDDSSGADQIPPASVSSHRVTQAVNRVRQTQERWKGQVSQQRSNTYTKQNILA